MGARGRRALEAIRIGLVPLVFLLLAAWISYEALKVPLGTFNMPGAGFFPLGLGLLLGVLSLVLWLTSSRRPAPNEPVSWPKRREVICLIATVLAAALLFESAGFLVTMTAFLMITTSVLGNIGWVKSTVLAVVGSAGAYLIFVRLLKIALPDGVLPM